MCHYGGSLEGQKLKFNVEGRVLPHNVSQANKNSIGSWAGDYNGKDLAAFCLWLEDLSEARFYINVLFFFSVEDISKKDNVETELFSFRSTVRQGIRSKKIVKCESLMGKGMRASLKLKMKRMQVRNHLELLMKLMSSKINPMSLCLSFV